MNRNEPGGRYRRRLYTDFPDFQVPLVDGDELLAEAHAIPLPWDGSLDDDGEYVFPHGLATLSVRDGIGTHIEPNVWLLPGVG